MQDDEISLKGFLDLNMMEAQDADGDPNDLWLTLENMGFNKALELDQVHTYGINQLLTIFLNACFLTILVPHVGYMYEHAKTQVGGGTSF